MRKSKFVVAVGAAVALAATPLMTSTALAASGSNAGGSVELRGTAVAGTSAACGSKQIDQPSGYPSGMKLADVSGLSDFTPVSSASGVKFSPTLEKRSVPGSWLSWGSPPDTESATPHIMYTVGAVSIDVTFPKKGAKKAAGMEVEPNLFQAQDFTAVFKKKNGSEICTATVNAHGDHGAKLLAAKVKKAKSVTVSSPAGDFSIAQVRWK